MCARKPGSKHISTPLKASPSNWKPSPATSIHKVVAASRLWELGDNPSRVLGQRKDTPDNEK
jgi:hypothetical protein